MSVPDWLETFKKRAEAEGTSSEALDTLNVFGPYIEFEATAENGMGSTAFVTLTAKPARALANALHRAADEVES